MHALAIAPDPNVHGSADAPQSAELDVFPGGIHRAVDLHHLIAFPDACLRRRAVRRNVADQWGMRHRNLGVLDHE